ncbi:UDP-glucuronosyl/UDP-glucosyltransferase [Parasponia andersonii]|uniref:UDP-glucuronosyl/UDP-glucosyltransferase n=1 Tax=Parasponia andersonii TaxID=3476 RepID=A0A2P5AP52_PARAD|nr:UDP-glucuronosyl/UDP-glucosyltransferase [Parasponia andersonii]
MSRGHMIPSLDMAKLFASQGCKTSIISTHSNAPHFHKAIETSIKSGLDIQVLLIKFPAKEHSLGHTTSEIMRRKFLAAVALFEQPLEQLIMEHRPNCVIVDTYFSWSTQVAARFGIPRLVFHGMSFFATCAEVSLLWYEPHKKVLNDSEAFAIPNLPDEIRLTRNQLPDFIKHEFDSTACVREAERSESLSYGVVVNSFYELEPAYADHYRKVLGRKAWHVGPAFLCDKGKEEIALRGREASNSGAECLKWLDSKKPNSVVYVCFGSMANFKDEQLMEIATGLEASLREVVILEHEAVGGFVTHCGWNSTLEGVSAGVPMITWPLFAEQFYNEKLVTQILKIGVEVIAQKWVRVVGDFVKRDAIEKAVSRVMAGEEAEEMRSRARKLAEKTRKAFEEADLRTRTCWIH